MVEYGTVYFLPGTRLASVERRRTPCVWYRIMGCEIMSDGDIARAIIDKLGLLTVPVITCSLGSWQYDTFPDNPPSGL
jgi:hypothetical protein